METPLQVPSEYDISREEYLKARFSHDEFLNVRDWALIEEIWRALLRIQNPILLPKFIRGNDTGNVYGMTDLDAINVIGQPEFSSTNPKFKRTTLAFCIGYLGSAYSGYQQQKGVEGIITVEDDLDILLGKKVTAAGRTDKGVSALSQVVSYATYDPVSPEEILSKIRSSEACQSGRLAVWSCKRVPRKFHPLFGATWRRYLYLFPLKEGPYLPYGCDVDVNFINEMFSFVEGKHLPYNGYAHRENRVTEDGSGDICILHQAKATVININEVFPELCKDSATTQVMCVELVGDRFLRRMATAIRESVLLPEVRNVHLLHEIALSRNRNLAAAPAPGTGLGLCGVGYDLEDLADMKGSKKPKTAAATHANPTTASTISTSSARRKRKKEHLGDTQHKEPGTLHDGMIGLDEENLRGNYKRVSGTNTAVLQLAHDDRILIETLDPFNSWSKFGDELISHDPDLLFQPERAFSFDAKEALRPFSIVLPQSFSAVDSTIWDAETILAHYLHDLIDSKLIKEDWGGRKIPNLLELGAGTALASLTWLTSWKQCITVPSPLEGLVLAQEIPEVLPKLESLISSQIYGEHIQTMGAWWGDNMLQQSNLQDVQFDCIVMADVLYHEEHFSDLVKTIFQLLAKGGDVILVFEQRRKDLSGMVQTIANGGFQMANIWKYEISGPSNLPISNTTLPTTTVFYVCHFHIHDSNI